MNVVAIIPARAGSKGIIGKNLVELHGRPLIDYTIQAAIDSNVFSSIIVSSDGDDILEHCSKFGQSVIACKRPDDLSTDSCAPITGVLHALQIYEQDCGVAPSAICLLQPTSPMRTVVDIQRAVSVFKTSGKRTLISVCEPSQHPSDCLLEHEGKLSYAASRPAGTLTRRQEFPACYFINGAIYITERDFLLKKEKFFDLDEVSLFFMDEANSLDIDTRFDLTLAEGYLSILSSGGK